MFFVVVFLRRGGGASLVCGLVLNFLSSFAIILLRKSELVVLVLHQFCHVAVCVLCLFLAVPWVGL